MATDKSLVTNPELLRRLANWDDADAWLDFVRRYESRILQSCRATGLGPEAAEEVTARVLMRLVTLMRSFSYDPSKSFRSWLAVLARRMALGYHRERSRDTAVPLTFEPILEPDDADEPEGLVVLLGKAAEIQERVRRAGDESSWQVFWRSDVQGEPLREVADSLGLRYHAAFMAQKRVRARLAREGQSVLAGPVSTPPRGDAPS